MHTVEIGFFVQWFHSLDDKKKTTPILYIDKYLDKGTWVVCYPHMDENTILKV